MEKEIQMNRRFEFLISGYIAFVMTMLAITMNQGQDMKDFGLIIALLFLSLPSLVSSLLVDYIVRVKQERKHSMIRGLSFLFGFGFSFAGLVILLSNYSHIASILFVFEIVFWFALIDFLVYKGRIKDSSI